MKLSVRDMTRVALFTALICLASLILKFGGELVVPFSILPLMVMLTGAILGPRLGAISVAVYVLIGLVGAPVFAKPPFGGLTYIFQPSFGFLPGFILAAYVVGWIVRAGKTEHYAKYISAMLAGVVAMYLVGIPYLYIIIKFYLGKTFTMWSAIQVGLLPFIGLDLVKAVLAGVAAKVVLGRLERQGGFPER